MGKANKVIVALDGMNESQALDVANILQGYVWGFKVNDLLIDCGLPIISKLKKFGNVFADPKLHDIPNTVANGIKKLDAVGADLITVHASGGRPMLEAAAKAAATSKVLAVTLLTSLNEQHSLEVYGKTPNEVVTSFAELAASSGIHGMVCSPKELNLVQNNPLTKSLIKVIPGIRPTWYGTKDDQQRTMGPKDAIDQGADLLVIGRPITGHESPQKAAELIAQELAA